MQDCKDWLQDFLQAANEGDLEDVMAYIAADRSLVNAQDERGRTALHMSCSRGQIEGGKISIHNTKTDRMFS